MEKKEQKESIEQPLEKEKDTDLSSLRELSKRLGAVKVEPPKSVLVIFPNR